MKLFKKIVLTVVGATMAIGVGVGLNLNSTDQKAEEATAAAAGTYTYDFESKFTTYSAAWPTGGTSNRTIQSDALGSGLPASTFAFTHFGKAPGGTPITNMPVTFSRAGTLLFTLKESGFQITKFSFNFKQWESQAPTFFIYQGSSNLGIRRYLGNAGMSSQFTNGYGFTYDVEIDTPGINSLFLELSLGSDEYFGWRSMSITIASSTTVPVTSISINPTSVYLPIGGTTTVSCAVLPSTATSKLVTYSLLFVSPSGCVTWDSTSSTLTGVSIGTATLRAISNDNNKYVSTISVNIVDSYSIKFSVGATAGSPYSTGEVYDKSTVDGKLMTYTNANTVYGHSGNQMRLGYDQTPGSLAFKTPNTYKITKVVLLARAALNGRVGVKVNGGATQAVTTTVLDYYAFSVSPTESVSIVGSAIGASYATLFITEIILVREAKTNADYLDEFVEAYMHTDVPYNVGDTNSGACLAYYAPAKAAFNALTPDQRALFVSSSAFAEPYARLLAWAAANGDTMSGANILSAVSSNYLNIFENTNYSMMIIVIISAVSLVALGAFFFIRKKKEAK